MQRLIAAKTGRAPRVCIVTPGQIGSNPRVVKEADALHEAGHEVSVIATRMLDLVEPRDQALMRRIPWRLERIDLRSRARWRLLRAAQVGARRVYAATGLARFANVGQSACTPPLRRAALATPADLYIAHYPAALPAVAAAARKYGARYAYDAEDYHLGDWPDDSAYDIERRLVREIECRYLPGCAYVTAASPDIAEAYAEAYGIARPHLVLNAFPLGHAPPGPTPQGAVQPGPSLYWFSQTVGPDRGLECAVRAIGLAQVRPHLYLRGTPAAGYAEQLIDLARSTGAGGRIHILPPEEPDSMEELAAAYDAGLVAETGHSASRHLCLSNKLFSFLLAGIPPLMSDTPAHTRFAAEAGVTDLLYPREDAAALAQLIDRILGNATRLAARRAQSWRLGQKRYNWDRERSQLVEAVGRATLRSSMIEGARAPPMPGAPHCDQPAGGPE
jgi:glycosyltransferase involved in cell wall biosynthesis